MVVETSVALPAANSASTAGAALGSGAARTTRRGQRAAERRPALDHVLDLLGTRARVEVRRLAELVVGDGQLEPVAEHAQLVLAELLRLVGEVAGLDALAQRPALDGLGQDHGRGALVLGRGLVGGERPCGSRGRRGGALMSSSERCSTSLRSRGSGPKKFSRT